MKVGSAVLDQCLLCSSLRLLTSMLIIDQILSKCLLVATTLHLLMILVDYLWLVKETRASWVSDPPRMNSLQFTLLASLTRLLRLLVVMTLLWCSQTRVKYTLWEPI